MYKNRRDISGFTLVELMVAISILLIVVSAALLINIKSLESYYTLSALNELNHNGSLAMDEVTQQLRESNIGTVTIQQLQDPATGFRHDVLIFASARGNPLSGDGNFHIDTDGEPDWQSAVCYYPFTTQTGTMRIHRYVAYDSTLTAGDFPMTATITSGTITLIKRDGTALASFSRANGAERVLANYVSTEDQNSNQSLDANENDGVTNLPMDNQDNELDTGLEASHVVISGGQKIQRNNTSDILGTDTLTDTISLKIFLQKPITALGGAIQRRVAVTLNTAVTLRN